jgi:hypothetical protein
MEMIMRKNLERNRRAVWKLKGVVDVDVLVVLHD